jgi:hypothetical protein
VDVLSDPAIGLSRSKVNLNFVVEAATAMYLEKEAVSLRMIFVPFQGLAAVAGTSEAI